ncbi:GerMN domain-containing protein [Sporosalibacterium faouarense]|uniref:GerMN domain-containing protein n=1 Tax=Sporosalibacterium faouarense TaxID=516123 RepID=UPI00141D6AA0|nr:GerMN domain-containing protein [Sporosalibacterium faouarense]MTI46462.1 GerMN domain-containing protein [Bacillota bacterium]
MNNVYLKIITVIIISLSLSSCSNSINYIEVSSDDFDDKVINPFPEVLTKEIDLYFGKLSPSRISSLYKEAATIEYSPGHLEEAVLSALKSGPKNNILFKNIMAPHLEILDVNVAKESIFVNFSSKNLYGGKKEESLLIASIVKTLTEMGEISKVYFLVDGKKTDSLMGNIATQNYFTKDSVDILLKDQESLYPLTLWFPDKNGDFYSKLVKEVRLINHSPNPKTVIGNLLIGPTSPVAKGCIPSNIEILDVWSETSTTYVNLSSKNLFLYKGNYSIEYNIQNSITKSLLQLDSTDKVVFLINGKKGFRLIEKIAIDEPFTESDFVVKDDVPPSTDKKNFVANIYHPTSSNVPLEFVRWERSFLSSPTPVDIISSLLITPPHQEIDPNFTLPYIVNITQENTTIFINFSSGDLELYKDTYKGIEMDIISSIVKSLCDLDSVENVMFLIDGHKSNIFIEKVRIDTPINNETLSEITRPLYDPNIDDFKS